MARNYSLEDIETLRSKAGVSYEDAVSLLEKYDGDVARALIELEKRGQLGKDAQETKFNLDDAIRWIRTMWKKGLTTRVIVERKGTVLVNLSVSVLLLMLITGVYAMACAIILTLLTGCSVSIQGLSKKEKTIFDGGDEDKSGEPAAENIEPSIKADEPEKTDDDDFPSITIS